VANSSSTAIAGASLTTLREGDKQIPVVARLGTDEIAGLNSIEGRRCRSARWRQTSHMHGKHALWITRNVRYFSLGTRCCNEPCDPGLAATAQCIVADKPQTASELELCAFLIHALECGTPAT